MTIDELIQEFIDLMNESWKLFEAWGQLKWSCCHHAEMSFDQMLLRMVY